jgi:hypothetical protein
VGLTVFGDAGGACQQAKKVAYKESRSKMASHLPSTSSNALLLMIPALFGVLLLTFAMVQFVSKPG